MRYLVLALALLAVMAVPAHAQPATKTASGIVITTIKEGTGATPATTDTVKVNYEGTLKDGTVFDSSYQRGKPATFALNQVIPCWTEVVSHMKVGGTVSVVCPTALAYGAHSPTPAIPPNSDLVFKIELLDVVK